MKMSTVLELAAVQHAQQQRLSSDSMNTDDYYYCVGYSVLHYKLDEEVIGSLLDQTGRSASVDVDCDILATCRNRITASALNGQNLKWRL